MNKEIKKYRLHRLLFRHVTEIKKVQFIKLSKLITQLSENLIQIELDSWLIVNVNLLDFFKFYILNHNCKQAKIWILENQLGRRNLNDAQRIDVVDKLFGLKERKLSEERKKSTLKKGDKSPDVEKLPQRDKGKTRDKLGKKAKVSRRTYEKGKKIKENNPELWQQCLDGKKSIDKALKHFLTVNCYLINLGSMIVYYLYKHFLQITVG